MAEARTHSYRRLAPENFTMKAAILAVAAAAGLALTAGSASAQPGAYYGGYHHHHNGYYGGGYSGGYYGGYYAPRPVVVAPAVVQPYYAAPVYPAYGYGYPAIRPGFSITIGSGYGFGPGYFRY
jgi:hypothetical protein